MSPSRSTTLAWSRVGLALCASLTLGLIAGLAIGQPIVGGHDAVRDLGTDPFRPVFTLDAPLLVSGTSGQVRDTTNFRLPDGARQDTPTWYVLDVALQVDFDPAASPDARSYVSVLTNGHAAAQVQFFSEHIGDQPAVQWSNLDLFSGARSGLVFGESITLHLRNYLQVRGVQPGNGELTLQLEHSPKGAVVPSARLLPGSGITSGEVGPPHLQVEATVTADRVRVGETLSLHYRITSQGFPASDAGVLVSASGPGIAAADVPSRFLGTVTGVEEGQTMHFRALAPGRYHLTVKALGATGGRPRITIPVEVLAPDD